MTAAPEVSAPAADTSFESELGAAFSSAVETVAGTDTPAEPPAPAAITAAPVAAEPVAEAVAPAASPAAPATPADPASPYALSPDGQAYLVPKTELPVLNGMKVYAEAVQARFPTAADAEVAYKTSSDFSAVMHDFLYGKETDVDNVLGFWAGDFATNPQFKAESAAAFERMANRMPDVLRRVSPEAYGKFTQSVLSGRIQGAYDHAAQTGDPQDLLDAQMLDWGVSGQYKTELPKHDPIKAEEERLASQRRDVEQRETALVDRDWGSFNQTSLDGPKWGQFNGEIDKVLAPVKDRYDPDVFAAVRDRISKQLLEGLQKDFDWARTHNNERSAIEAAYRGLWKQRQPADSLKGRIQTYTTDFMARVRRNLPSIAAPLLSKATARPAVAQPNGQAPASPPQQPTPARAPNGQFQKNHYSIHEDPEFSGAFRVS